MSSLTVLDLLQCFFWAAFGIAPLLMAYGIGWEKGKDDAKQIYNEGTASFFVMALAIVINAAGLIAAYKAGGGH